MNRYLLVFVFVCILLCSFSSCGADSPDNPMAIGETIESCEARAEICGDGIDQDRNGSDVLCPGNDKDRDGYASSVDCDDTSRKVYPGVSVSCNADCGVGTRTCQESGNFTQCSCNSLCEAKGIGKCYYVSRLTGDDSNNGSFSSPWRSYLNFVSYYSSEDRPVGWIQLKPGDVVYFMSGVYDDTYEYYAPPDRQNGLFFRGVHGSEGLPITIKVYPGEDVTIAQLGRGGVVYILQSSRVVVDGFNVRDGYSSGVKVSESSFVEVKNCKIYNIGGDWKENMAGIYVVSSTDVNLHHLIVFDNYDRSVAPNGGAGNRNFSLFKGGNVRVHHNVIFHSQPGYGGCVLYKHSQMVEGGVFQADHNILWNCNDNSIGTGSFNSIINNNLIMDSVPITLRDWGGETYINNVKVYNNTVVRSKGYAFVHVPTDTWPVLPEGTTPVGPVYFYNNVMSVDPSTMTSNSSIVSVGCYQSDALYNKVVTSGTLHFSNNCYYAGDNHVKYGLFAANGGNYGVLGADYSFGEWSNLGYDNGSSVVNPEFTLGSYESTVTSCVGKGWLSE